MVEAVVGQFDQVLYLVDRGGCYEDGPALYEKALPGIKYKTDYISVEVRSVNDPYTALQSTAFEMGKDMSIFF